MSDIVVVSADGTGATNCYDQFNTAITKAKTDGASEIFIPEGKYLLLTPGSTPTSTPFALDLEPFGLPTVRRFRGAGSNKTTLIVGWTPPESGLAEGKQISGLFRLRNLPDMLIEGLTFDVRNLTSGNHRIHAQGKIISAAGSFIEFQADPGFAPEFVSTDFIIGFGPDGAVVGWNFPSVASIVGPTGSTIYKAFTIAPGTQADRWTIDLSSGLDPTTNAPPTVDTLWHGRAKPVPGQTIVIPFRKRGNFSINSRGCKNLVLRDIQVRATGYGLLAGGGNDDLTIENVAMRAAVGGDMPGGTIPGKWVGATGISTQSGRGIFTIREFFAEYLGDDVFNNNTGQWFASTDAGGSPAPLAAVAGDTVLQAYFRPAGGLGTTDIPPPVAGDVIEIWSPALPDAGRTITSVLSVTPIIDPLDHIYTVTLRDPLPSWYRATTVGSVRGSYIFNRSQVQKLRFTNIESRACAGTWRIYSDDAQVVNHKVTGHYGAEIIAVWPGNDGNQKPAAMGYAGGLSIDGAVYTNNGHGELDYNGATATYLFIGNGINEEPSGPLPSARPVTLQNVRQQRAPLGGIMIVGHDATILSLEQANIGVARTPLPPPALPISTAQASDVHASAGTVRLGTYFSDSALPRLTGSTTGRIIRPSQAIDILPETARFLGSLPIAPTTERAKQYDALIRALVASNNWRYIKGLHMFAAEDDRTTLQSLVDSQSLATATKAVFTPNRGFTGNVTDKAVIDTRVAASAMDTEHAFAAVWILNDDPHADYYDVGLCKDDPAYAGGTFRLNPCVNGQMQTRMNDTGAGATASTTSSGFFGMGRVTGGKYIQYPNAVAAAPQIVASTPPPTDARVAFLRDGQSSSARQIAFGAFGSIPNAGNEAALFMNTLRTAVSTYLKAVGAIP